MGRKKKSTNLSLFPIPLGTVLNLTLGSLPLFSQAVLTRSYDNLRSGGNTQEKNLTPASVGTVKKLRELTLDSDDDPRLEAQPLYVPRLQMGDGPHDVVIVSMANNIYAFDVNSGAKLWKQNIGIPVSPKITGKTAFGLEETEIDSWGINLRWGILSAPVIDIDTKDVVRRQLVESGWQTQPCNTQAECTESGQWPTGTSGVDHPGKRRAECEFQFAAAKAAFGAAA